MILFVYRLLPAIFYNISYKTKYFISKFTLRVNSKQGIALALGLFDGSPSNIKMRANLGGSIAIKNACHDVGIKRREAKPHARHRVDHPPELHLSNARIAANKSEG